MMKLLVLQYQKLEPLLFDDFTYGLNNFRHHLMYLKEKGYNSITCRQLEAYLKTGASLPDNPVLITFDAGFAATFKYGRAVLKDFGYTGTFFIVGEWALKSTCEEPGFRKEYMHIDDLRQLHQEGFELAMHGYSNRDFRQLAISEVQIEIEKAFAFFRKFELPYSRAIAYPVNFRQTGYYRRKEISFLLTKLGVNFGFQTGNKTNKMDGLKVFEINRIEIGEHDTKATFANKIKKPTSWLPW
jgi:peptidoglycan/xylan/chitin deacetylase (PgdA/CDA1 family)